MTAQMNIAFFYLSEPIPILFCNILTLHATVLAFIGALQDGSFHISFGSLLKQMCHSI